MKALIHRRFGGPEVLEWADGWPEPRVASRQTIVRVGAGSVNPKDALLRKGMFRGVLFRRPLPRVVGCDVAGEIVEVGSAVSHFKPGDRVYGMTNRVAGGVHAELAVLHEKEMAPAPEGLSVAEAAAMPLAAQTALQALRDLAGLGPGSRVLVNGASGGVGHFAVQIAGILGAEVLATCSERNVSFVESLGADRVFDHRATPATGIRERVDCVFDVFGKNDGADFARQLSAGGTYINTIPRAGTLRDEILSHLVPGRRRRRRLVLVRSRSADLRTLSRWVAEGRLRPFVEKSFPFADAAEAHRHIETRHTRGKIVLVASP